MVFDLPFNTIFFGLYFKKKQILIPLFLIAQDLHDVLHVSVPVCIQKDPNEWVFFITLPSDLIVGRGKKEISVQTCKQRS